jgi:hypothetical protein
VGKPKGKRPLERTMHRWENNIRIILKKENGLALSDSRYEQVEGSYKNSNEPLGFMKCKECLD